MLATSIVTVYLLPSCELLCAFEDVGKLASVVMKL